MSEYHFEYQCSNLVDAQNKKALRFSLFQDYQTPRSPLGVMIYIPKSKQKNLQKAVLYYQENGMDFPDITKDTPNISLDADELGKTNAFFIRPALNCSGTGVITLLRKGADTIKQDDTYRFTINFLKKADIQYEIKELDKDHLQIKVLYPRILRPITLVPCFAPGRKPLFIKEYANPTNQLTNKGKPVKLVLPVMGSEMNCVKFVIKVDEVDKNDFRLTFLDEGDVSNFDLYNLIDESEITLEEKGAKLNYYEDVKRIPYQKIKICPYCGGPLSISKKDGATHTCDGKELKVSQYAGALSGTQIVCQNCYNEHKDVVDGVRFIPLDMLDQPVMHTLFIGAPNSGKTMFLASIINLEGNDKIFKSVPVILNMITQSFSRRKNNAAEEFVPPSFLYDGRSVIVASSEKRLKNQKRYSLQVNSAAERYTEYDASDRISWNPQAYKLNGLGYAFFYDVPGEAYIRDNPVLHSFDMIDSIIAVVDGYPSEGSADSFIALEKCLDNIEKFARDRVEEVKNMPIAVVFTKMDRILKDHTDAKSLNDCLDDNCHITREDMSSLLPKNGKYEGSELQRHIDNSSYELVHYAKSEKNGASLIKKLKGYKRWKFFSTSALGSNDVLDAKDKSVLFKNRTLRVELPLIWLMYQKHLIKK